MDFFKLSPEMTAVLLGIAVFLLLMSIGALTYFVKRGVDGVDAFKKDVTASITKLGETLVKMELDMVGGMSAVKQEVAVLTSQVANDRDNGTKDINVLFQRVEILGTRVTTLEAHKQ